MNEIEHERVRQWEESCAQKDGTIIALTAERDALAAENDRMQESIDLYRKDLANHQEGFKREAGAAAAYREKIAVMNTQLTELREAAEAYRRDERNYARLDAVLDKLAKVKP